jgi:hypothetical protein
MILEMAFIQILSISIKKSSTIPKDFPMILKSDFLEKLIFLEKNFLTYFSDYGR